MEVAVINKHYSLLRSGISNELMKQAHVVLIVSFVPLVLLNNSKFWHKRATNNLFLNCFSKVSNFFKNIYLTGIK
jgi:hypothetical protein